MKPVTDDRQNRKTFTKAGRVAPMLIAALLGAAGLGFVLAPPSLWLSAAADDGNRSVNANDDVLVDVRIEGNTTIPAAHIGTYIKTRAGRPASPQQIQDDVRSLFATRYFFNVEPRFERTDRGLVLVFRVLERPVIGRVLYRGNKHVSNKQLAQQTGLVPGSPFDVSLNKEAAHRLQKYYRKKGYQFSTVQLARGDQKNDREVVFDIHEGEIVRVNSFEFIGNKFFSTSVLKTKLRTKKSIAWVFGGLYDPKTIHDDLASLKQYYHSLGFFDVKIQVAERYNKKRSRVNLEYKIVEGSRYKIRHVEIVGSHVISEKTLRKDFELRDGDFFKARDLQKDIESVKGKYGELGRLFAKVKAVPRFLETPGVVDLVYQIDEDYVYRIRRINVVFKGDNPRTRTAAILNRMLVSPGDVADPRLIKRSEARIKGSGLVEKGPLNGTTITMTPVTPSEVQHSGHSEFRGQSFDGFDERSLRPFLPRYQTTPRYQTPKRQLPRYQAPQQQLPRRRFQPKPVPQSYRKNWSGGQSSRLNYDPNPFNLSALREANRKRHSTMSPVAKSTSSFSRGKSHSWNNNSQTRQHRQTTAKPIKLLSPEMVFRGQNYEDGIRQPGNPVYANDPNIPFGPGPRYIDLNSVVTEARTGRLMFGVGVNSDAGIVGSFTLSEQNFDITRFPRGINDFENAFRGNGEQFRLDLAPGKDVSRYLASWTSPYFLDTDYSLSLSGFYYKRFLQDWDEQRAGGRIAVGKALTPDWSVSLALRLEQVTIDNPDVPTPAILAKALGNHLLSTAALSIAHDTRNTAFLPGEGHLVELGVEQAFGDFSYTRATLNASQHFTIYERPDGFGRHILTLRGQTGWTGDNTPIFERFFAGGYQTFRGFEFRGVSPRVMGTRTGGRWMALGSVEYQLPLMANETVQGVAFTDFGTVENDVGFDNFRMTAGVGLRLTIPAMGPVPLAFDFAFPIFKEKFDDDQIFSFYLGLSR